MHKHLRLEGLRIYRNSRSMKWNGSYSHDIFPGGARKKILGNDYKDQVITYLLHILLYSYSYKLSDKLYRNIHSSI